ncbi:MAG: ABC transporter permease [Gemmatimonadota bacterium]|jgi:predicted permease
MDTLLRDIRFALKVLWKEKTFSATILATLALCIGANAAIFSVVRTVLLEPLPYHDPGRLVTVYNAYPAAGAARGSTSSTDFFYRREGVAAFAEVASYQGAGFTVGQPGSTERVQGLRVTPSFFPLLGVTARLGRTFTEDEMNPGSHRKVVLTEAYWREHFGGDAGAVGRTLRVDGEAYEVVGVLPGGFQLPTRAGARIYVPVSFTPEQRTPANWHNNNYSMIARLRPGATLAQATAQLAAVDDALKDAWPYPNGRQVLDDAGYHSVAVPMQADLVRDVRPTLLLLWAGVGFVLLIGCVNIANLMLARGQARSGEVATRLALGARRATVARQVLTEALALGVMGAAAGAALGWGGLHLLQTLGVDRLPRGTQVSMDDTVLIFTLALGVVAGAVFGAIPVAQAFRGDLGAVFRAGGRTGTASRRAVLLRNGLVTSQVALAFLLLIGSGLMLESFREALAVDPGFDPTHVFTGTVALPESRYPDADARRRTLDEILRRVREIPGIRTASVTTMLPFSGGGSSSVIIPESYVPSPGESVLSPYNTRVGADYFETLGIDLMEGRTFRRSDGPDAPQVIILDEWLARRYWPDGGAVGSRMAMGSASGEGVPEEDLWTIVGVVKTIKQNDLTAPLSEHVGAYYRPVRQLPAGTVTLVARTVSEPAVVTDAVRRAVTRVDPDLPLFGVETMERRVDDSLASRRIPLVLLGVFAGVALFLAVVGIYGALAYAVAQRTREIGIRMAMGSAPRDVFGRVVAEGFRVTAVGLVLGVVAALLATRLIRSLLFAVEPTDPWVLGAVTAVLALVGLVACLVPARRATAVDPVRALTGV